MKLILAIGYLQSGQHSLTNKQTLLFTSLEDILFEIISLPPLVLSGKCWTKLWYVCFHQDGFFVVQVDHIGRSVVLVR